MTQVDDYGRYEGRNSIIWSESFSVWNEQHPGEQVTCEKNAELCKELEDAKLVFFYEVNGRRYCVVNQWGERARGDSKWPKPPDSIPLEPAGNGSGTQLEKGKPGEKLLPSSIAIAIASDQLCAIYDAYPRKVGKPKAIISIHKALETISYDDLLSKTAAYAAAVSLWPEDQKCYIPYPATFFNQARYNDDPKTWKRSSGRPQEPNHDDGF